MNRTVPSWLLPDGDVTLGEPHNRNDPPRPSKPAAVFIYER